MSHDFDLDIDVKKDFEVDVDVEFDVDVKVDVDIDKDIDVKTDIDLDGNAATLSLDVQAIGYDTLVEVVSTVLATDNYSSVTVEAGAFVD